MKYSYQWIQEHIKEKLPAPGVLAEEIIFHAFEVEDVAQVGEDTVLEIKVLPDRAGDCLSHSGMAREIAGLLGLTFKEKEGEELPAIEAVVPVQIQNNACHRYIAVRIDGVKVGPSPAWLKERLAAIGQRSINNIVDATNFILFDSGQPVHAFDAAKIDGGIVVRFARDGESIKLLGGEERVLKESDLVIADYLGAIAIAGVKGGVAAEVTDATESIMIEVAHFDATAVRKTSRRLSLITDASKRFENNFSPLFALPAAAQAAALIKAIAGGEVVAIERGQQPSYPPKVVAFAFHEITRLLGGSITSNDITQVFDRYRYEYELKDEGCALTIPHYRADITGVHDIAEEVGRCVGYERIPSAPLPFTPAFEENLVDLQMRAVRAWAVSEGYREVSTYSFRGKGEVSIAYGAKGKDKLRSNLSDGLKESYELNRRNAPLLGLHDIRIFEIGTVFFAEREEINVAVCDKGMIQELPLTQFIKEKSIEPEKGGGSIAMLPKDPASFRPWSPYPFITRDIALWVESDEARRAAAERIEAFADRSCAVPAQLFDEFSKDGKTSIAYRLVFQAMDKTLTDGEVEAIFGTLTEELRRIEGVTLR